ncbi:MAG: hypothetical protein H0V88_02440 [Pyrinomonadaceae bacterium]|nr:hypothetical protein [Pyrinomonadaceae bacterium]
MSTRVARLVFSFALLAAIYPPAASAQVQDLSGAELLRVTRVAQGGTEYAGLQYVTARSEGFVNLAPFGAFGLGTGAAGGMIEVRFKLTDYQGKDGRRRLEVTPAGPVTGPTFLTYTGTQGGGMFMGNEFRVTETAASRQWALMGFDTLNHAAEGKLPAVRQPNELSGGNRYFVVDVRFSPQDAVRYYIDQNTFLIGRVVTRFNNRPLVDETRGDYRKVGCMMMPFHIVTRLNNQRLADLNIAEYDVQTVVPSARFTLTAMP